MINLNANYFYLRFVYFCPIRALEQRKRLHSSIEFWRIQTRMRMIRIIGRSITPVRIAPDLFPAHCTFIEIDIMIVCVCNNISDREIRQAVDLGLTSMADLYKELGVGTCCGKCVSYAREVMHEHLESKTTVTELRRAPHGGMVA